MKLRVVNPDHPLPPLQMGVSMDKMNEIFIVLDPLIRKHTLLRIPRAITLQKIADLCATLEEFASVLDVYYAYLHEVDAVYP